jgi:ribulose-bisphosphate carboxylase large chain
MGYIDLKYKPEKSDLICFFRLEPARGVSFKKAAEAIASESSTGTWVEELVTKTASVKKRLERISAKVFEINGNYVKIAYPFELFEPGNMPQILSSIAGNIFGMKVIKNLRLEDVNFPEKLIKSFKGPKFGIEGIRKLLKIYKRPLTGTIIKPKVGLNEKEHAKVAYDAWVGGIDSVKDDENLSSLSFNNFSKRVLETLKMREKAENETGERKIYMPNITAEIDSMLQRANFVRAAGGEYVMVDIITTGWSALQTLRNANEGLNLVLHAHRAGHAAITKNQKHGIAMKVIAKLARIIGLDQLHVGTIVGKMFEGKKEVLENCQALKEEMFGLKKVMPVASGGLHPLHIPELLKNFGSDVMLQFGGGCHGHPLGTTAGAKAIRQALEASMQGVDLKDYSKTHKELKVALKMWGK